MHDIKSCENLILVRGVSGSGKSTFALEFIYPTALVISTDDFFMEKGEYKFDPSKLGENHQKCIDAVEKEMVFGTEMSRTIVVHNTFTEEREMKPYLDLAEKHEYNVYTIIVENRHESDSVHGVPTDVIQKQKNRFQIKL